VVPVPEEEIAQTTHIILRGQKVIYCKMNGIFFNFSFPVRTLQISFDFYFVNGGGGRLCPCLVDIVYNEGGG